MDAASFDWCSFYALFWNDKGIKCKVNIPDTVLFRYGQLSAWWSTNKEGGIQRHTSQSTSIEAIRKRFLGVAQQDNANYSKFVAISWLGSGKPQLLRVMAFNQLCEILSDRLESGRPDTSPEVETPLVLQAFIQPWQDLRYITTYINTGTAVTCHTFQRKYSRRYTPMSAATAAQLDARDADIILSVGPDGDARRAEIDHQQGAVDPGLKMMLRKLTAHIVKYIQRAHGLTLGGIVCEYVRDADGKVFLTSVLRTEWISNAAGHGAGSMNAAALQAPVTELTASSASMSSISANLAGMAHVETHQRPRSPTTCETIQEETEEEEEEDDIHEDDGEEGEFDQSIAQHGSTSALAAVQSQQQGSLMADVLTASTAAMQTWAPTGPPSNQVPTQTPQSHMSGSPASSRPVTARPGSRGGGQTGEPLTPTGTQPKSNLVQYPGGQSRLTNLVLNVSNTWPSQQHEASLGQYSPASNVNAMSVSGRLAAEVSTASGRAQSASPGGMTRSEGYAAAPTTVPPRPSSSPTRRGYGNADANAPPGENMPLGTHVRSVSPTVMPGRAPLGFGSTTSRVSSATPDRPYSAKGVTSAPGEYPVIPGITPTPMIGALTAKGQHITGGPRGAPLMISHLQQEVETLRDQLLYQHELAEASAAKVRQLERESAVVTTTFDNRQHELDHLLIVTRNELAAVKADRDSWQSKAVAAEARLSGLESERITLSNTLSTDRATTMSALREYQERDEQNKERIERLEGEVVRLSTNLKMETTAVNSLKRQLLEFAEIAERNKATLRDADLDPALVDVMARTSHLLAGQTNPTGEQYAIQKILSHYHSDLRSVFLFYCQLDQTFTDHWPPVMGFAHWMLFCKDSETTDSRAGARVRSSQHFKMLHPQQCEALFTKYSESDDSTLRQSRTDGMLTYEGFLCCIVGTASLLRRPDVPYLSEGLREYILRYLSRARRVKPEGLSRGTARQLNFDHARAPSARGTKKKTSARAGVLPPRPAPTYANEFALDPHALPDGFGLVGVEPVRRPKSKRSKSAVGSGVGAVGSPGGSPNKSRPSSPTSVKSSSRPGSAAGNPARMLYDAERTNSAVMKELALLTLSGPGGGKEIMRTGGGFTLA